MSQVKAHVKKTKSGKLANVKAHNRVNEKEQKHIDLAKKKAERDVTVSVVKKRVQDKDQADSIISKYSSSPLNMKLMTDSKWKTVKTKNDKTKKVWAVTERTWIEFVKQNHKIIRSAVSKVNLRPEDTQDLINVGITSLYDGANSYASSYDPKNPKDALNHLMSVVTNGVRLEVNKRLVSRFTIPHNKNVLYNKFRALHAEHNGDWDKIHNAMNITVNQVYSERKTDEPLSRNGFVATDQKQALEAATKAYEDVVNKVNQRYVKSKEQLKLRSVVDDADIEMYKEGVAAYDAEIKKLTNVIEITTTPEGKASITAKIEKKAHEKKEYELNFKPLTDADLDRETEHIENQQQTALRQAKKSYDRATDAHKIKGTNELFKLFESLMSMSSVNLSGHIEDGKGEKVSIESLIGAPEEATSLDKIIIKQEFKFNMNELERSLEFLKPFTRDIMKMRLGLHDENKLYPHGLWGEPMSIKEIMGKLPDEHFQKHTEGTQSHVDAISEWSKNKPSGKIKVKRTQGEYNRELKDFDKRKLMVRDQMKAFSTTTNDLQKRAEKRAKLQVTMRVRKEDRPTMFANRDATEQEMSRLTAKWNKTKPQVEFKDTYKYDKIAAELSIGRLLVRRMFAHDKGFVGRLIDNYQKMRKYGISKGDIIGDIQKSLIFDNMFGVEYVRMTEEEGIVHKAYNKVKGWLQSF